MAKDNKFVKKEEVEVSEIASVPEMTLEEARAYRAALYKPEVILLTDAEKREAFRKFWAQEKSKYGKSKDIEPILWAHMKSTKHDDPAKFEDGIAHFGLKKIK